MEYTIEMVPSPWDQANEDQIPVDWSFPNGKLGGQWDLPRGFAGVALEQRNNGTAEPGQLCVDQAGMDQYGN